MITTQELTDKQARFCEEYLIDLNATQAAIRAGYSEKTANEQGARLLANVSVQEKIAELKAERSKRTEITQDSVIQELAAVARAEVKGVRAVDKLKALELLGKHLGMFVERYEVNAAEIEKRIAEAREQGKKEGTQELLEAMPLEALKNTGTYRTGRLNTGKEGRFCGVL